MADMVEVAKGGILKTHLMFRANLSAVQNTYYTSMMLQNELLRFNTSTQLYYATEKGLEFLNNVEKAMELAGIERITPLIVN
jgi:predicted transcriptional regulator